jgi:hypothetical protein
MAQLRAGTHLPPGEQLWALVAGRCWRTQDPGEPPPIRYRKVDSQPRPADHPRPAFRGFLFAFLWLRSSAG